MFAVIQTGSIAALFLAAFLVPGAAGSAANLSTSVPALQKHGFELVVAIAAALQGAFWAYDGWQPPGTQPVEPRCARPGGSDGWAVHPKIVPAEGVRRRLAQTLRKPG
ncbi:MAG: hypothetical protein CK546_01000 [Pedosphaera sp.]|nr:MAG: hypothetical protein CK538_11250 [Opitutae bacterium]PHX95725.1 MAG: hypothetical protein CK546_01000 [Pedosphaera sp.]